MLHNARLFAPEPRGVVDLLVGGERLLAIGAALGDFPGAAVIDLEGARVIPGLIDAHVHLSGGGGESGPASRVPRVMLSALSTAGITTCVGVLGTDGTTRTMADLVACALGLRAEGISAYCWTGSYQVPPLTLTGSVRSDIVFVDPILGCGELAISDHRSSQPTHDELARIAADCHVAGLMSGKAGVLHLHLGDGARGLTPILRLLDETELPPRTFHPTHVNRNKALWESARALAKRGTTIDVTAFPVEEGEDAYSAEDAIERYLDDAAAPRERLTCSSDGGGCLPTFDAQGNLLAIDVGRPASLHTTLVSLLRRGRALEAALPVFTSNVADTLRLKHKGRLAVGADADLVVLDDAHRITEVMARGRWLLQGGAPCVVGGFE